MVSRIMLKLSDQREQAKFHWLKKARKINGDNTKNRGLEENRHFTNEMKESVKNNDLMS
jgi:hypothetical protein